MDINGKKISKQKCPNSPPCQSLLLTWVVTNFDGDNLNNKVSNANNVDSEHMEGPKEPIKLYFGLQVA